MGGIPAVKQVQREQTIGAAYQNPAPRLKHPCHLFHASFPLGQITKAVSDSHDVERLVTKRQSLRVRANEVYLP